MPKAVLIYQNGTLTDSSIVLNRVADANLGWLSSWQIGRCLLIAVSHSVRLPTRHDVHMQPQSMGNCVQMCRPTTHTCTHSHSPWIELLFIGLQIGVMSWLRRWHHSAPAAPPHGTILMGVMWLWASDLIAMEKAAHDLESWKITAELHRILLRKKERGSR